VAPSSALQPKENQSASRDVTTRTNRLGACWITVINTRMRHQFGQIQKNCSAQGFLAAKLHRTNREELVWAVTA